MFEIEFYTPEKKELWNSFVSTSKNGTFLFDRDYMDYHSDRFLDCSVMVYRKGQLYCILPANCSGNVLYSHQGLTYGGMIMNSKVVVSEFLEAWTLMNDFYKNAGIKKVVYKTMPFIYHRMPAQEDIYALFKISHAHRSGVNISSAIFQNNKLRFTESRKGGVRKSIKNGVSVFETTDFAGFWDILNNNLQHKYGVKAVHTLDEILLLKNRFPQNIKLYAAFKEEIMLGGTVIYITSVLDLIFDFLLNQEFVNYPVFDFGQSTEEMGNILNESLIFQKEGFGGRGVTYDIYEYEL